MSTTFTVSACGRITDGPARYPLIQGLANRQCQLFQVDGVPHLVRIDGVRPFVSTDDPCHRWVVIVYLQTGETCVWYYDSAEREGSTAIPIC